MPATSISVSDGFRISGPLINATMIMIAAGLPVGDPEYTPTLLNVTVSELAE